SKGVCPEFWAGTALLPSDKPARRLEDIIENAQAIQRHVAGMDLTAFERDQKPTMRLSGAPKRISEAAAKLGDLAASLVPSQPWHDDALRRLRGGQTG